MSKKIVFGFIAVAMILALAAVLKLNNVKNTEISYTDYADINIDRLPANASEEAVVAAINNEILTMTRKDQVIPKVNFLIATAAKYPEMDSVQVYAAMAKPLLKLEGVIWRFRDVVKKCGACHMAVLGMIKDVYYADYMYGPHLKALRDFLVEPGRNPVQFKTFAEAQDYFDQNVIVELENSKTKLNGILNKAPKVNFLNLDGYLLTGYAANFRSLSEKNRFKTVVSGNLHYVVAALESTIAGLTWMTSYQIEELPTYVNRALQKSLLNNATSIDTKHTTPLEYLDVLNSWAQSLGKARFDDNVMERRMSKSFNGFKRAMDHRILGLEQSYAMTIRDKENSQKYLLSPKLLDLDYDATMTALRRHRELYNGLQTITSEVTGLTYRIDLPAAFSVKENLQNFLPKREFASVNRETEDSTWKVKKWDYYYGLPKAWKDPTFGGLLPGANDSNLKEIVRSMKLDPATRGIVSFLPVP